MAFRFFNHSAEYLEKSVENAKITIPDTICLYPTTEHLFV